MKYLILLILVSSCNSIEVDYKPFCNNKVCKYTKTSYINPTLEILTFNPVKVYEDAERFVDHIYVADKIIDKIPSIGQLKRLNQTVMADRIVVYENKVRNEKYNLNSGKLISSNNQDNVMIIFFVRGERIYE